MPQPPDGTEILFHAYLLSSGRSLETAKSYQANLRIFSRWCDNQTILLAAANRSDVERYLAAEFGRLARNTVAARLAAIRCFLDYSGHPEVCAGLKVKREKLAPRRPLSLTEEETLLSRCRYSVDRAMVIVAIECGLRISELCGIRRDDIDTDRDLLLIRGKGARQRWVALRPRAKEALLSTLPATGLIWRNQTGSPITVGQAKHTITRAAERAGIPVHWHRLRTTFASRFLARTHDIDSLRTLMGHEDTSTTARYSMFEASDRALAQMRG